MRPVSMTENRAKNNEAENGGDLSGGKKILEARRSQQTHNIDQREQNYDGAGHELRGAQAQREESQVHRRRSVRHPQAGEEVSEIRGNTESSGGNGRGEAREERYPPGQESPNRSPRLGEVNVFAAGAREVDAQLRVAERAGQGQNR